MSETLDNGLEKTLKLVRSNQGGDVERSLLERLSSRRDKLAEASSRLKAHFVGLDDVIDQIISNIEVWYVMPEVISRPVIVNLWGMTGVGKTDLVRKLVKYLDFSDKFFEIQMTNKGISGDFFGSTIQGAIERSNLETKETGIILFDEIQRFRTVSELGGEIHDCKYQDLWMLLSDGKFSGTTNKESIFRVLFSDYLYWIPKDEEEDDDEDEDDAPEEPVKKKKKKKQPTRQNLYKRSYYDAKRIKKALRLKDPIEDIMQWSDEKKMEIAVERMESQETYEGDDYSKTLIFVSGNLDEAYKMAKEVSDYNTDADVLHNFSKRINIVSIKNALKKRFKPEQISRMGNTHIIYPSIDRASYEELIKIKTLEVAKEIKEKHNVTISIDESLYDFVYRNGVIPSQGVRPLFSTISSYIENAMPIVLLECIENDRDDPILYYKDESIRAIFPDKHSLSIGCTGAIDEIKKKHDPNSKYLTAVHESGHALAYSLLFGVVPTQIAASVASSTSSGFVGLHKINYSRDYVLKIIKVFMAGQAAEEIAFGCSGVTAGASSDMKAATSYAIHYIKEWGMANYSSYVKSEAFVSGEWANNDVSNSINDAIELMIKDGKEGVKELLLDNLNILKASSKLLAGKGTVDPYDYKAFLEEHGVNADVVDSKKKLYDDYTSKFNEFIGED
jgi:hypothetical protein